MNQNGQFSEKKENDTYAGMVPTYASSATLGPKPVRDYATEQSNAVVRAKEAGEANPYEAAQSSSKYSIGTGITSKQPGITAYLSDTPDRTSAMRQAVLNRTGQQSNYSQGERQLDASLLSRSPTTQTRQVSEGGVTWNESTPVQYMPTNLDQYSGEGVQVGSRAYKSSDSPEDIQKAIVNLRKNSALVGPELKATYAAQIEKLQSLLGNASAYQAAKKTGFDFTDAVRSQDTGALGALLDQTYGAGNASSPADLIAQGQRSAAASTPDLLAQGDAEGAKILEMRRLINEREKQRAATQAQTQAQPPSTLATNLKAFVAKAAPYRWSIQSPNAPEILKFAKDNGISKEDAYALFTGAKKPEEVGPGKSSGNNVTDALTGAAGAALNPTMWLGGKTLGLF